MVQLIAYVCEAQPVNVEFVEADLFLVAFHAQQSHAHLAVFPVAQEHQRKQLLAVLFLGQNLEGLHFLYLFFERVLLKCVRVLSLE